MNPAELFRLETNPLTLKSGETLFCVGDPASEMFVLLEGQAEIIVGDTVVETSGPGALLGEMALIEDAPRSATVVTKTDCKFARINPERFKFLVQQTPFFSVHVMKVLVERLRAMNHRIAT
jgi:CRP/FNR family transcriptional regulator, cyclic AMP receptor protein